MVVPNFYLKKCKQYLISNMYNRLQNLVELSTDTIKKANNTHKTFCLLVDVGANQIGNVAAVYRSAEYWFWHRLRTIGKY